MYGGGIDTNSSDIITIGGAVGVSHVVNDCAKWYIRDEIIRIQTLLAASRQQPDMPRSSEPPNYKMWLAIVGLSPPIAFSQKLTVSDGDTTTMHTYNHTGTDSHHQVVDVIKQLQRYLNQTPCDITRGLIHRYGLKRPAIQVGTELAAYLARHLRSISGNMRPIKISNAISFITDDIHGHKSLFAVDPVTPDEHPATIAELVIHLMGRIATKGPKRGKWPVEPIIDIKHLRCKPSDDMIAMINQIKSRVGAVDISAGWTTDSAEFIDTVKTMTIAIVDIHKTLLNHMVCLEQRYYDIATMFDRLRQYMVKYFN